MMSDDLDEILEISSKKSSPDPSPNSDMDAIQSQIPVNVKFDFVALVYGCLFIGIGGFLLSLGSNGMGAAMIVVGILGVIAGLATLVWKSPKVKILQAVDNFLIAILLFVFAVSSDADNPALYMGFACWMLWVVFGNVKDYLTLSKMQKQKT